MCGIFFCVHDINTQIEAIHNDLLDYCNPHLTPCTKLKEYLDRRGPDSMHTTTEVLSEGWTSCILSTVLWTQGSQITTQPLQDNDGNILLWNGDILYGPLEDSSRCDSEVMFEHFKMNPLNAVTAICGPYAFVFWDKASQQLWFGRDVFGRHSLLWNVSNKNITLTSTGHRQSNFTEVPALGIYKADLSNSQRFEISFFPWAHLVTSRIHNFPEMPQVNVSQENLTKMRNERIADLIHPLTSVLDDSIGCALWFAASGQGVLNELPYSSPARIVLLGMGADEQLGGYIRHRNTLKHTGQWAALGLELLGDTDNISHRNLGRDNRVVCDHGRQPRTPFLDEKIVAYINSLAPWHRCMLTSEQPPGLGDKFLLRMVARRLGLNGVSTLPKRALQFGSRIANHKEKGNQVSKRL